MEIYRSVGRTYGLYGPDDAALDTPWKMGRRGLVTANGWCVSKSVVCGESAVVLNVYPDDADYTKHRDAVGRLRSGDGRFCRPDRAHPLDGAVFDGPDRETNERAADAAAFSGGALVRMEALPDHD